jgi:2-haloacid dehalogenase
MVAAHDMDLNAARAQGFRSAFVARRAEWGGNTPTPTCADHHDFIVDSLEELADQVGT